MAKIIKRGNMWYSDFTFEGIRIRRALCLIQFRPKALQMLKDLIDVYKAKKTGVHPKSVSWFYLREQVLEWYKENTKGRTHYTIKSAIETIERYGRALVHSSDVTPNFMEDFLKKWIKAGFKKETGLSHLRRFKTAMKWAETRELITPRNWGLVKMPGYKKRVEYFTYGELDQIIAACRPLEAPHTGHWKTAAILMAYAGLRSGEVRFLRWEDIDWKNRYIHVRAKTVQDADGNMVYWEPKESLPNEPWNRKVDMDDRLEGYLKSLPSRQGFVLGGDLVREHTYRRYFGRLSKKVKFKVFAHKFRHTYAAFMCSAGVTLEKLQELMGHKDIRSTAIYKHLMPHARRSAVDQMSASLPPSPHFPVPMPHLEVLQANG